MRGPPRPRFRAIFWFCFPVIIFVHSGVSWGPDLLQIWQRRSCSTAACIVRLPPCVSLWWCQPDRGGAGRSWLLLCLLLFLSVPTELLRRICGWSSINIISRSWATVFGRICWFSSVGSTATSIRWRSRTFSAVSTVGGSSTFGISCRRHFSVWQFFVFWWSKIYRRRTSGPEAVSTIFLLTVVPMRIFPS